ncbi:MAG: hypothetical protein AAFO58_02035 [Pseudomonadota bacterium]
MRRGWHILREGDVLTLARRLPVRFDIAESTQVPLCDPARLIWQVRQDLWRKLQRLRGFSPVVRVTPEAGQFTLTAGGRLEAGRGYPAVSQDIRDVICDRQRQERWLRWARKEAFDGAR